jgi:hypothetical protein
VKISGLLIYCLFIAACSKPEPREYLSDSDLKQRLAAIVIKDGIDRDEAAIIAESYHRHIIRLEGAIGDISLQKPFWVAVIHFGFTGEPLKNPLKIDKRSGKVSWDDGPTIDDPKTIWSVEPINWGNDVSRWPKPR